jgi:pimeloyl-ACP methyl ester carboxylesterase
VNQQPPPELDGVEHRYVVTPAGVRIHVAVAGPQDGPPVMLVHGFPQHWWEWREMIGPLAAGGYRVLCPDLRGAGWSDAPAGPYRKADMAEDLAAVLDALEVGPVRLVAHDWGGPVAFILLLNHPEKVSGFLGLNTIAPWLMLDLGTVRHLWRFWYQLPMATPVIGPKVVGDPRGRYLRFLCRWVGGGFSWPEPDARLYIDRISDPARALAGSRWYRTFQSEEAVSWLRGEYADARPTVPLRWLTGLKDPVITPNLHRSYTAHSSDIQFETAPGIGHWIIEEAPALVLDRIQKFLRES